MDQKHLTLEWKESNNVKLSFYVSMLSSRYLYLTHKPFKLFSDIYDFFKNFILFLDYLLCILLNVRKIYSVFRYMAMSEYTQSHTQALIQKQLLIRKIILEGSSMHFTLWLKLKACVFIFNLMVMVPMLNMYFIICFNIWMKLS